MGSQAENCKREWQEPINLQALKLQTPPCPQVVQVTENPRKQFHFSHKAPSTLTLRYLRCIAFASISGLKIWSPDNKELPAKSKRNKFPLAIFLDLSATTLAFTYLLFKTTSKLLRPLDRRKHTFCTFSKWRTMGNRKQSNAILNEVLHIRRSPKIFQEKILGQAHRSFLTQEGFCF